MINTVRTRNIFYGGLVNMGLLRVLHPLSHLLFELNLPSVRVAGCVLTPANMAFEPWRESLKNNTGDVIARQAEGLV